MNDKQKQIDPLPEEFASYEEDGRILGYASHHRLFG